MAYTLNTGHALYANLIELIGVQAGALVSHKTAQTFTKHAAASYVTGGTYGEALRCVQNGYESQGASISPGLTVNSSTNPNLTVFIIVNSLADSPPGIRVLLSGADLPTIGYQDSTVIATDDNGANFSYSTDVSDGTAKSLCLTRTGESAHQVYVNASSVGSGGKLNWNASDRVYNYIGGHPGQTSVSGDIVWIAIFNKVLSGAEITALHNSLGANNAFGLVAASGGGTTLSCTQGSAAASGFAASIAAATVIACSLGSAAGAGYQANVAVSSATTINCSLGVAAASGYAASVAVSGTGTLVTEAFKNNTGTLLTGLTVDKVWVIDLANAADFTGVVTNGTTGVLTVSGASIVPGHDYLVVSANSAGTAVGVQKVTAT